MEDTKKIENLTLQKFLFSVQNFPSVFISISRSFLVCMPCQPYLLRLYTVASTVHNCASLINEVFVFTSEQIESNKGTSVLLAFLHSQRGQEGTSVLLIFYTVKEDNKELLSCWFLHSQRGQQGTSSLVGHLQSGQSSSLKSIVHGGSCTDHTILFAIKEYFCWSFLPSRVSAR